MDVPVMPAAFVLPESDGILLGPAKIWEGFRAVLPRNAISKNEADQINQVDIEPLKGYCAAQFGAQYLTEGRQADVYWSSVGGLVSMWIPSFSGEVATSGGFIESDVIATLPQTPSMRHLCYCTINGEAAQATVSINVDKMRFDGTFVLGDSIHLGGVFTYERDSHPATAPLNGRD